jgi:RNA polymerase sigma-70 factor (ECF subfamily)
MSAETPSDPWPSRLAGEGREQAVAELRLLLLRGLAKALAGRAGVDDAFLEDAVQEALLRVLRAVDTFEGRSQFTTWAIAIAVRTALTELRRRRWRDVSLESMSAEGELAPDLAVDPSVPPDRRQAQQAIFETLSKLIYGLPPRQREAIQAEMAGVPLEEIGRRLGINRNAVYQLTHNARKNLLAGMQEAGHTKQDVLETFSTGAEP